MPAPVDAMSRHHVRLLLQHSGSAVCHVAGQQGRNLVPLWAAARRCRRLEPRCSPTACRCPPLLQVVSATGSGVATFAITRGGGLYTFGSSKRGQLGLGPGQLHAGDPQELALPAATVQVSAGWGHAAALLGGLRCMFRCVPLEITLWLHGCLHAEAVYVGVPIAVAACLPARPPACVQGMAACTAGAGRPGGAWGTPLQHQVRLCCCCSLLPLPVLLQHMPAACCAWHIQIARR